MRETDLEFAKDSISRNVCCFLESNFVNPEIREAANVSQKDMDRNINGILASMHNVSRGNIDDMVRLSRVWEGRYDGRYIFYNSVAVGQDWLLNRIFDFGGYYDSKKMTGFVRSSINEVLGPHKNDYFFRDSENKIIEMHLRKAADILWEKGVSLKNMLHVRA